MPIIGILLLVFWFGFAQTLFEKTIVGVIGFSLAMAFRYLFDPKEVSEYLKYEMELEKQEQNQKISESNVNENIAAFIEEQRIKKQNAKWWQFWI